MSEHSTQYNQELKRQRETLLQHCDDLYAALAMTSPDAVTVTGTDLRIIMANMQAATLHGFRIPEQMIGKNTLRFIAKSDRRRALDNVQRLIERGTLRSVEYALLKSDGTHFIGEVSASVVFDEEGAPKAFICVTRDITKRKEMERQLCENEEKFRLAFEHAKDAIVWADPATGTIINCNKAAEFLFEKPKNEIIGEPQLSLHPAPKALRYLKMFQKHIKDKMAFDAEAEIVTKSGAIKPVHITASVTYVGERTIIQGIFRDITARKKAEAHIADIKKDWDSTFEEIDEAVIINDTAFTIVRANKAAEQLFGMPLPKILKSKCYQLFYKREGPCPSSWCIAQQCMRTCQTISREHYEPSLNKFLEVEAIPSFDHHKNVIRVVHVIKDITERKRAEEILKDNEIKYRTLVENVPGMTYRGKSDWSAEIISGSKAVCGYTPHEINTMEKNWLSIIHPADRQAIYVQGKALLEQHASIIQVYRILHKEGDVRWVEDHKTSLFSEKGDFIGIDGIVFDVTERKRVEETLYFSDERFRQIAENAQAWIWEVAASGLYTYSSPICEKILGYGPDEIVGNKHFYDLFLPEEREAYSKALFEFFSKKEPFREFVCRCRHKDGSLVWVSMSGVPVFNAEGVLLGYRGADTDITPYKKSEAELQAAKDKLQDQTWGLDRTNKAIKLLSQELQTLNKELIKSNKKLTKMSLIDSQTGLFNHRYFENTIEREFYRAERENGNLALIMIDLDYFKSINDTYGHKFGDVVLKQFAAVVKKVVRRYDIAVRYGGEEFVIISPGSDRNEALTLALRIFDSVRGSNFGIKKNTVKLQLSMAVVSYPEDKIIKSMDLIELADRILDKAKEDGANRIYASRDLLSKELRPLDAGSHDQEENVAFLKGKISKLTKNANQSLVEAVFAFAKALKLKDSYTGEHTENTVLYATELARALGLSAEEVKDVRQAAILHDLGKIGIPESILQKKASLTPQEFEEIKRHPQIAVDIIRPIHFLHKLIPLIRHHHERWDGKGYPDGLKAEHIPLGARIVALADVYHSLISDRPYRKAFSKQEALHMIKEGAGTQFDPRIVDLFLKIFAPQEQEENPSAQFLSPSQEQESGA